MQSTHRGDAIHARSNSGFVNEMKEPPTSAKSIKGWNNDGQSKALNQSPLKKLDAVYNHTKKDMESLERYINMNEEVLRSERKSRTPGNITRHRNEEK